MTYITSTSSFPPAGDDRTFDRPNHSCSQGPTNVRQSYPHLVPNYYLGSLPLHDPVHHARVAPIPSLLIAESEHYALYDPRDISIHSPNYLNSLPEQSIAPVLSLANGELPYDIPYANQSHLHQADETMPDALPAPRPSGPPYSILPTAQRPRNRLDPTNVPLNAAGASDQTQIQPAVHLSISTTFHEFGGNAAPLSAPPVPLATTNSATSHSNTVHICRCVTGGSPCHAAVNGSVPSVRDHLSHDHGFRCVGKDKIGCFWLGCRKRLQRESIARHIVTCHLRVKVNCVGCGLPLSRSDVQYSHAKACRARRQIASQLGSDVSSSNSR